MREHARDAEVPWWSITPFGRDEELTEADLSETTLTKAHAVEAYRGDTARALADVKGWLGEGWRVVLVTEGHGPAERLVEVLRGQGVPARLDPGLDLPGRRSVAWAVMARLVWYAAMAAAPAVAQMVRSNSDAPSRWKNRRSRLPYWSLPIVPA